MTKVLILYYSAYGHMERMAQAVAEGVKDAGAEADIKRVPELVPEEVAKQSGFKLDQKAPIATIAELADYDAIIFGSGTRFGVFTSQMRNFLDQTGPLWMKGALVGKVGSMFTGSGTQHGGQESTIFSMIPTLLHHGMIVVGLPYSFQGQSTMDEISGCSPYGASTITKPDGSRMPSENELAGARFQGRHVAQIASKLRKHDLLLRKVKLRASSKSSSAVRHPGKGSSLMSHSGRVSRVPRSKRRRVLREMEEGPPGSAIRC